MSFQFLYITNSVSRARFAKTNGIDFIFIDMEVIGKEARQPGNTVKNNHTIEDVLKIKKIVNPNNLLVRINPYGEHSRAEIDSVIGAGATHIMIPMINSSESVFKLHELVAERIKIVPLVETIYSLRNIEEIIRILNPAFVFFGLNDLHRELKLKFMFEVLALNLLDFPIAICRENSLSYGFGGVTKLDSGLLNSKFILNEHIRLGSSYVILSRDFSNTVNDEEFANELHLIRSYMKKDYEDIALQESSFNMKFRIQEILEKGNK